jgi:hypothetical protein
LNNAGTAEAEYTSIELTVFGGLFTEATPESLPSGASPLSVNCDYDVGSVFERPGLQSAYVFDTFIIVTPKFAQSVADAGSSGEIAWLNPTNVELNTPGTYATVSLDFGTGGAWAFDQSAVQAYFSQSSGTFSVSITPTLADEWGLILNQGTNFSAAPTGGIKGGGSWPTTSFTVGTGPAYSGNIFDSGTVNPTAAFPAGTISGLAALCAFFTDGLGTPTCVQSNEQSCASVNSQTVTLPSTTTIGNTLIAIFIASQPHPPAGGSAVPVTIADTQFNPYVSAMQAFQASRGSPVNEFANQIYVWTARITQNANLTLTASNLASLVNSGVIFIGEFTHLQSPPGGDVSQQLQALNYGLALSPFQQILGIQALVGGHQSSTDPSALITVKLFNGSGAGTTSFTQALPGSDGTTTFGTVGETWGFDLTPALLNDPGFGMEIQAVSNVPATFFVYQMQLKIYLTPFPAPSFLYLKTFELTDGAIYNLALASTGTLYQEDVINDPGVLSAVYTQIEPNSFAQSCTLDDREFIAVSDLQEGTDIPIKYNPTAIVPFTRISQVGPGNAPSASTTTAGSTIATITQQPAFSVPTGGFLLVSAAPGDHGNFGTPNTPGNVLTFVLRNSQTLPTWFQVGINVVIKGLPTLNGFDMNNGDGTNPTFYTVTSVGGPITGQTYYDAFTVTVPYTTFINPPMPAGITVQGTLATLTATAQVPNIEVGSQLQIAGTGGAPTSGYDGTWNVEATPNAAQVDITATELINNVAIYSYTLVTGSNPVAGQYITIAGTFNGNGIFNLNNAVIASATSGTFSINLQSANIASSSENGSGIIFGTIFQFDPEQIVGNKSGGTIVAAGLIAEGQRLVVYQFLTVDGYLTQPSPITTFQVPSGASSIVIGNLLTGPSNVVARVISLTLANGAQFYNLESPVTVTQNGVNIISQSTWVLDNSSTSVTLTFQDAVLAGGAQIDVTGSNSFETAELGSCTMLLPYAQRLVAVNEQNKVTNFLNWSFDGGIAVVKGGSSGSGSGSGAVNQTYPAGWTIDPVFGAGGSVGNSPVFGFAYIINNATGVMQSVYGMIEQPAYQDSFGVPIIQASTLYSVRVTASFNGVVAGSTNLKIELFSPKLGIAVGAFSILVSTMSTTPEIFTGTLLTQLLQPVPNDLILRIWAGSIASGVIITIDRVEPFPTDQPNLNQQVTLSYQGDFEAFDQVSGVIQTGVQNQQPCVTAFTLFESLYLVKTGSFISTKDNQQTEPEFWPLPRLISNSVGTPSVYGVTSGVDTKGVQDGEEWALIAGQSGLYIFNGGEPVKLSEEIQSLWDYIYWLNGYLLWVVNDILNRRILVGVPMLTQKTVNGVTIQNPWLPAGIIPTQTAPSFVNCILELNYKQLNTAGMLSERIGVRTSYSGKLVALEITRKWSLWTVQAPCAAFLRQPDGTAPLFVGNSVNTGKIYEFIDNLFEDDGQAIYQAYQTFGFVQGETGQQSQMGLVRYNYDFMTMILTLEGTLTITVYPNSLLSPYSHTLLPNLEGPINPTTVNGDIELPVNETGSRLFFMFNCNAVGSAFSLSRIVCVMHQDPWAPVRGGNY